MEFIRRTTLHASPVVSFPHFKLDVRRYQASWLRWNRRRQGNLYLFLNSDQLELEDLTIGIRFSPGVYKLEHTVV
jgi:hypothetical protein